MPEERVQDRDADLSEEPCKSMTLSAYIERKKTRAQAKDGGGDDKDKTAKMPDHWSCCSA